MAVPVELLIYLELKFIWRECYTKYSQLWVWWGTKHITHQEDPGLCAKIKHMHSPSCFWDITPCSLWKVSRRFRETCRFPSSETSMKHRLPASRWYFACLKLGPWSWRWYVTPKRLLTFNKIYGVISKKIGLIITTVMTPSYPIKSKTFYCVFCGKPIDKQMDRTEVSNPQNIKIKSPAPSGKSQK
jgi:hypothetical protein